VLSPQTPVRQTILVAAPLLILASQLLVFRAAVARFGVRPGYLAGFVVYWACWCAALPLLVIDPADALAILKPQPLGASQWSALLLPLALGYGYAFPRALRMADAAVIALSALLAIINAPLEELLWRGAYVVAFPNQWWLGWASRRSVSRCGMSPRCAWCPTALPVGCGRSSRSRSPWD
jgi:uncharacterized protein